MAGWGGGLGEQVGVLQRRGVRAVRGGCLALPARSPLTSSGSARLGSPSLLFDYLFGFHMETGSLTLLRWGCFIRQRVGEDF